jgi:6-phosphogluconolactonase/glucosamine-6-phosphate isomerase/deaminase
VVHGDLIVVDDLPGAFASTVIRAYQERPDDLFSLALGGGSTAAPCYERLAAESMAAIDWLSVNVYWADERCVAPDDPDSNQLLGRRSLLLDADPGQLVALNEDPSGRNVHSRMTLTLAGIARARLVIFTIAGESKRETLQAVVDGADLPAGRVTADRVVWLVDRAAAPTDATSRT